MNECKAFGYADHFKQVSAKPESIQKDLVNIEKWCSENKMKLNVIFSPSKCTRITSQFLLSTPSVFH